MECHFLVIIAISLLFFFFFFFCGGVKIKDFHPCLNVSVFYWNRVNTIERFWFLHYIWFIYKYCNRVLEGQPKRQTSFAEVKSTQPILLSLHSLNFFWLHLLSMIQHCKKKNNIIFSVWSSLLVMLTKKFNQLYYLFYFILFWLRLQIK